MTREKAPGCDRRVRRSQVALQRALLELIEEIDPAQLTVATIAERADVNRSTFYAHYRDVHELAEAACTEMIDELVGSLAACWPEDPGTECSPALVGFFSHLAEHAGLYRTLLGPCGSARVLNHVLRRMIGTAHRAGCGSSEAELDVPAAFTAGGLVGVAVDWLERGCPRTPAEMAALARPFVA